MPCCVGYFSKFLLRQHTNDSLTPRFYAACVLAPRLFGLVLPGAEQGGVEYGVGRGEASRGRNAGARFGAFVFVRVACSVLSPHAPLRWSRWRVLSFLCLPCSREHCFLAASFWLHSSCSLVPPHEVERFARCCCGEFFFCWWRRGEPVPRKRRRTASGSHLGRRTILKILESNEELLREGRATDCCVAEEFQIFREAVLQLGQQGRSKRTAFANRTDEGEGFSRVDGRTMMGREGSCTSVYPEQRR